MKKVQDWVKKIVRVLYQFSLYGRSSFFPFLLQFTPRAMDFFEIKDHALGYRFCIPKV